MAPDTSSGAADRSGSGETGRVDDPWRRIETEQAERDRIGRAYDATHDPGEAFEKHHQDLPEQDRRPGKYTVDDFSVQQRAELEEMTGQKLEDMLAKRDQAFAEQQARSAEAEPGPTLETYPELPAKHTANTLVRAYENGELSYQGTTRRLELLGLEPRIREPEQSEPGQPDQPEQPEQAERSEQAGDPQGAAADLQAPSDAPVESDGSEASEPGDTAGGGDGNDGADGPGELAAPDRPEDLSQLVSQLANDLRSGKLTASEAADQLEALQQSSRPGHIEFDPPDGKLVVVDMDDDGRPDLSNARSGDGASQIDQLQSTRRIASDHGDQAAEPPKPTGDELSGESERRDLRDSRSTTEQLMGTLFKKGDDLNDAVEAGGKTGQQIFEGPQAGKAEVQVPPGEVVVIQPPPAASSDGADIASSMAALGLMLGAVYAKSRSNHEQKGQNS